MSEHKTTAKIVGRSLHVERVIRAPPSQVWKAWTTRETLERFFWPAGQGKVREFDFRPGGRLVMAHADQPWVATWRFKEIVPEQRIVLEDLWDDGSGHVATGTLQFQRVPEGTRIVVDHGPFPEQGPYRLEDATKGFSILMDRLAGLLEASEAPTPPTGKTLVTVPPESREIHIVRVFEAPRAQVWEAFTDAKLLAQWWGRGNKLDVERFELQRGGHWRFVEHGPEGTSGFEGRFAEIAPPDRLEMTFEWDGMPGHVMLNRMILEELPGGRTKLVAVSLFMTQEDRDGMAMSGMEEGMNQSYAALDKVLAQMEARA